MSHQPIDASGLDQALQRHFGWADFRPLQREIVTEVLAGRPAMAVLPTGGGKSLCYQLPALLLPGTTLVISPLISLMKDQVDGLVSRSIPAVAINSQDTAAEGRDKLAALAAGEVKLAFVAPERLKNAAFLSACARTHISLLAVDEAHCISQWGHDFRPDYRYIKDFHAAIGSPPLLALTATARPEVRADVMSQLEIPSARLFKASANRENLWLGVETCATVAERRGKLVHLARSSGGSTILYVSSRKDAEGFASLLQAELREPVSHYHAGLSAGERTAVQNRFMTGLCRVVVATNAFGMGIDKADIRAVIHAGVPESLEAYFQEVGRAGRDGLPAACTMVVVPGMDVKLREFLLAQERISPPAVEALFRTLMKLQRGTSRSGGGAGTRADTGSDGVLLPVAERDGALSLLVISYLQDLGSVQLTQRGPEGLEIEITGPLSEPVFAAVRERLAQHEQKREERFRRMRIFVYLKHGCRREYLLQYFGDSLEERPVDCCSMCHPHPLPDGLALATERRRKKGKGRSGRDSGSDWGGSGSGRSAARAESAVPRISPELTAQLLHRLKEWRRAKATAMSVPAYVVFGDKDLEGIAAVAPQTLDELAGCRGIGPVRLEQFGPELLAEIAARLPPEIDHFCQWLITDQSESWKQAVRQFITPDDYRVIRRELPLQPGWGVSEVAGRLGGRYSSAQISVAQAVWAKTQGVRSEEK